MASDTRTHQLKLPFLEYQPQNDFSLRMREEEKGETEGALLGIAMG